MKNRDAILSTLVLSTFAFALACGGPSGTNNQPDSAVPFFDAGHDASSDASADGSDDAGGAVGDGGACESSSNQSLFDCTTPEITVCMPAVVTRQQWYAQGFSPTVSGKLTGVRMPGRNGVYGSGAYAQLLVISAGGMGDEVLSTLNFDFAGHIIAAAEIPFTGTTGWAEATFETPPDVTANENYFLVLSQDGTDPTIACTHPSCTNFQGCSCETVEWSMYNDANGGTDSYARGKAFKRYMGLWMLLPSTQDLSFEVLISQCGSDA